MMRDKKNKYNKLRMILPKDIGKVIIKEDIDKQILIEAINELRY